MKGRLMDSNEGPVPPEEPFPYMTDHSYFGVNSPLFLTLFGLFVGGSGIWALFEGLGNMCVAVRGVDVYLTALGLVILGLGARGVRMGVARMKWKREYERVMGRSPFQ